ncbi:MAG: GTPase RsgA, partial [candidate division Zixibacteria bacterium]|nr:GTPase RsgA [candidate division Zixibacteria bacterium]
MMPVFLLNKADLCTQEEIETALSQIRHIAPGTALHALSAEKNEGVETLNRYVAKGVTVSLVGNSGVGKSTLINRLTGTDLLKT